LTSDEHVIQERRRNENDPPEEKPLDNDRIGYITQHCGGSLADSS
jgi:hypothetical protein